MKKLSQQAWVVSGVLVLAMFLGPSLVGAVYLNLASIEITRGYVGRSAVMRSAPSAIGFGDLPRALRLAGSALELNHANSAAWRQMGRALPLSGRLLDAEVAFHRAAQTNPDDVIAGDALAELHVTLGRPDQALGEWRRLRAASRLVALGKSLSEQDRWTEAVDAYRGAIEVVPGYVDAYYPLGWALYQHFGDAPGALSTFLTARDVAPRSPWPYVNIGDLYMARGWTEEAIRWYTRAIEVAPREPGLDAKLTWAITIYRDEMLSAHSWTGAECF